jgi:uncharacterized membrane protein
MVPVDSDYLTGLYNLSMLRLIYDFFIFICAIAFSYFFIVEIYIFLFLYGISRMENDSDSKKKQLLIVFDILCLIGGILLSIGLFFDSQKGKDVPKLSETTLGIFIFLMTFITLVIVTVKKMAFISDGKEKKYDYLKEPFFEKSDSDDNSKDSSVSKCYFEFAKAFFSTYGAGLIIVLSLYNTINDKLNINLDWVLGSILLGSCLIFGVLYSLIMSFWFTSLESKSRSLSSASTASSESTI